MANIDPSVAAVLDASPAGSDDEDALIAALEADEHDAQLNALREQRLDQLHEEFARARALRNSGAGACREVKDEKEVLDMTTSTRFAVVHFFKSDFARCATMDSHLEVRPIPPSRARGNAGARHTTTTFLTLTNPFPFLIVSQH